MRHLALLLVVLPLVRALCPKILEGLVWNATESSGGDNLREAVDTACGRRNFTSVFWSTQFLHNMIINIEHSSMTKGGKDEKSFVPIYESVNKQFKAMESCEAKEYVRAFSKNQRSFMDDSEPLGISKVLYQMFKLAAMLWTHPLSVDAQITLADAMKRGFEMVETTEMRRARIEVAMNAIERMESVSGKGKMSELYAQLYLLATEKSSQSYTITKETTSFEEFAQWAKEDWNATGVSPLEIVPAVETLYLQFRTLNNTEATNFVDWFLASRTVLNTQVNLQDEEDLSEVMREMARAIRGHESEVIDAGCERTRGVRQCFDSLPAEAKTALATTFPELATYLQKNGWIGDGSERKKPIEKKKGFFGNIFDFRRRRLLKNASMRLSLLLLSLAPLSLAKCPSVLQGLVSHSTHLLENELQFDEAVATSCGRKNFTSAFWSIHFVENMLIELAVDELNKGESTSESIKPLLISLRRQFKSMDNAEAKALIDAFYAHQLKFRSIAVPMTSAQIADEMLSLTALILSHRLSVDAQIDLAQTMKNAFGMVESARMKQMRIDTAMRAIGRPGIDKNRLTELYAQMYLLAKEKSAKEVTMAKETTSFGEFAEWMERDFNDTRVSALEILPAAETLYLQYRTLDNAEAKTFADWVLVSRAMRDYEPTAINSKQLSQVMAQLGHALQENIDEVISLCPTPNVADCFTALSADAKNHLIIAFPELSNYYLRSSGGRRQPKKIVVKKNEQRKEKLRRKINASGASVINMSFAFMNVFLLLSLLPLVTAECPSVLQGITNPVQFGSLDEAIETACGRRNFTTAFWSTAFYQMVIAQVVIADLNKADADFVQYIPLHQSLKDQFNVLDNYEARAYINAFIAHQRQFRPAGVQMPVDNVLLEMLSLTLLDFAHIPTLEAQFALMNAFKRGFGMVESAEMKRERIYVAMKAIERVGTLTHNEKLGELFAKMYQLVRQNHLSTTLVQSSFEEFADWAQKEWNSTQIAPLEVLPAVEVLYIQYHTLSNGEARELVDWVLGFFALSCFADSHSSNGGPSAIQAEMMRDWKIYHRDQDYLEDCLSKAGRCIKSLPNGGNSSLRSAFPELFQYIYNDLSMDHWAFGGKSNGAVGDPSVAEKAANQPTEEAFIIGEDEEPVKERDESIELILI